MALLSLNKLRVTPLNNLYTISATEKHSFTNRDANKLKTGWRLAEESVPTLCNTTGRFTCEEEKREPEKQDTNKGVRALTTAASKLLWTDRKRIT